MNINKFAIDHEETAEQYKLSVSGELDLSVVPELRSALEAVVNRADITLVLNLKNLQYIDSSGIGIIISVLKIRDELKAPFIVTDIPSSIKRIFDLTGISEFLNKGKEEAL